LSKCAECDAKIRLATDMAWQRFFPVKETFCRQCFKAAAKSSVLFWALAEARSSITHGDEAGPDPDSAAVLSGRKGGVP
jgi:hypothetical protein